MPAHLHANPMYQATLDLLDTLGAATLHEAENISDRQQLTDIQKRLMHTASFPDSASHYCKVINDQVLQMGSRALALGAKIALVPHESIDIPGEVRSVALCMAREDISRFKAFSALPEVQALGWGPQGLLREAYGSMPESIPAQLERYADIINELNAITDGLTPKCSPTDALDLQRMDVNACEGCPDKPLSSLILRYSLGEQVGLDRSDCVEMVLPEHEASFAGLNSRGFYAPDISHVQAVEAFRIRFYEGDLKRGLPPICENDLNGLSKRLGQAVDLAEVNIQELSQANQKALIGIKQRINDEGLFAETPLNSSPAYLKKHVPLGCTL